MRRADTNRGAAPEPTARAPFLGWTGVVLWAAGVTLASGVTASAPGAVAIALEAAGVAAMAASVFAGGPRGVRLALACLGLGLFLHAAAAAIAAAHALFAASIDAPAALALPVLVLLRAWGLPVVREAGTVHVQAMRDLDAFTVTWEKLGLLPGILVVAAGLAYLAMRAPARPWRAAAILVAAVVAWLPVRAAILVALYHELTLHLPHETEANFAVLFWSPSVLVVSFLPLAALLGWMVPARARRPRAAARAEPTSDRRALVAATILAVLGLTGAAVFHDPGRAKPGRVLVDEGHSDWERSDRPYDTEWYGAESGYNYYCIVDYLDRTYDVTRGTEPLTSALLAGYDVLVAKVPTREYEPEEVAAILAWVRQGGGLFLIGDHTNVFGSGVYLNQLAEPLGFRFRYDCVFDIRTPFDQEYRRPALAPHPVVRRLPPFLFATSCSVQPTAVPFEPVMLAGGLKTLPIDYSSSNFYPPVADDPSMRFGIFLQAIARRVGAGRVLGFTDSTVFSNFAAFHPGKAELFLASVEWLMRRNSWSWVNGLLLGMGALGALGVVAGGVRSLRRRRRAASASDLGAGAWPLAHTLFAVGLLTWAVTVALASAIDRLAEDPPAPRRPLVRVAFASAAGDVPAPAMSSAGDRGREYSIFFQWVLRLGAFPVWAEKGRELASSPDLLVLLRPGRDPGGDEMERIAGWVREGGKLLVLDGPGNDRSRVAAWVEPFGLACEPGRVVRVGTLADASGRAVHSFADTLRAWPVLGPRPILADSASGVCVGAEADFGRGRAALVTLARAFADDRMGGHQGVVPGPEMRSLYEIAFRLLRDGMQPAGAAGARSALVSETPAGAAPGTTPAPP